MEILRDLLVDGAALLLPQRLRVEDAAHANGFDVQGDVEVLRGDGEVILRGGLLGLGVEFSAHGRDEGRELGRREPGAPSKHHVLLRVRGARKPGGRLVRAGQVIGFGRYHRRERIADDDDAQAVLQGGSRYGRLRGGKGL